MLKPIPPKSARCPTADGLIFLPADCDVLPAGALVEFQPFCRT